MTTRSDVEAREGGFTLIELMIALVILAIVLAAMAPGFYNSLASASTAGNRNTADGLAVQALQQLQAAPYAQVGFYDDQTQASGCPGSGTVSLGPTTPSTGATVTPTSVTTVGRVSYALSRCVDWANDNVSGCTDDMKQTQVTVAWPAADPTAHVTETSLVYPGGQQSCAPQVSPPPPGNSGSTGSGVPGPPTNLAATDPTDGTGSTTIDLTWQAPTGSATPVDHYEVEYNTTGSFSTPPATANYASVSTSSAPASTFGVTGLTPGSTYYFQVVAVSSGGALSTPAGPVSATTAAAPSPVPCTVSNLSVSPSSAKIKGNGSMQSSGAFGVTLNATSACSDVGVTYSYSKTGTPLGTIQLSGSGGQLAGSLDATTRTWSVGTLYFTVETGGTTYSPLTQQLVSVCTGSNC